MMDIFVTIFSTLFLILGALIWVMAMLIILIGSIGLLRITVKEVFKTDVIKWFATYRKNRK